MSENNNPKIKGNLRKPIFIIKSVQDLWILTQDRRYSQESDKDLIKISVDGEILGFWTQILERVLRDLIYPPHSYRHMPGLMYHIMTRGRSPPVT